MGSSLIDSTLMEVSKHYHPGILRWMKRSRPQEWRKMISLEEKINQSALRGDEQVRETLRQYQEFVVSAVTLFRTPKGETPDLFSKSLIRG